jgi:hypothetical protein
MSAVPLSGGRFALALFVAGTLCATSWLCLAGEPLPARSEQALTQAPPDEVEVKRADPDDEEGKEKARVRKLLGDPIEKGLEWLALHQAPDGHWSLNDFHTFGRDKPLPAGKFFRCNCTGAGPVHDDIAGTALALLPFLAAGHTQKKAKDEQTDYSATVKTALTFLMRKQGKDGSFAAGAYSHGLATLAICEAYGLTTDPALKVSAQKGIDYIVVAQDPKGGGWRYSPRTPGDMSVTSYQLEALKSGQLAGLKVPREVLKKAEVFVDSCASNDKGFCYMPDTGETPTMTAAGLHCRQLLGVNPRNPAQLAGIDKVQKTPPGRPNNLYLDFYATKAMLHQGGDAWKLWSEGEDGKSGVWARVIARQDPGQRPHQAGSWDPKDSNQQALGRLGNTALSLLTLETGLGELPIFRRDGANKLKP